MTKSLLAPQKAIEAISNGEPRWILGMMSGTSLDGVDAALIETDGEMVLSMGLEDTTRFTRDDRALLRQALARAAKLNTKPDVLPADIEAAEQMITDRHIQAVLALQDRKNAARPSLIGFHGQTIVHRPPASPDTTGWTWQIGDAQRLADATSIPVVADFRARDMAAGGQGAPLVPIYHRALMADEPADDVIAVLNIGGVANITWLGAETGDTRQIIAFDTGPGNALLDDWMLKTTGQRFDHDGQLASGGFVHQAIIDEVLARSYFKAPPPKSLDRDAFKIDISHLTPEDGAATLTELSVQAVSASLTFFPQRPKRVYVCGGGRLNLHMMRGLGARLGCPVLPVEHIGLRGDSLEAEVFAWLAARHLRNLPLSLPETTGVPTPSCGGQLYLPKG